LALNGNLFEHKEYKVANNSYFEKINKIESYKKDALDILSCQERSFILHQNFFGLYSLPSSGYKYSHSLPIMHYLHQQGITIICPGKII